MARVWDQQAGQAVDVPDEEVQAGVAAGRYYMPKGTVPVVSPDGKAGTIPAEKAQEYFQAGFKFETPELLEQRRLAEEYGGAVGTVGAALTGAARGASLELSDIALRKAGVPVDDLRAAHPALSTGAEVVGAIAPVVLSGGGAGAAMSAKAAATAASAARTGAAAKALGTAAKVVSAPSRLAAKAGLAAESAVAKKLGKEGAGLASRILAKGAAGATGAAIEGGLAGAGHVLNETSLIGKDGVDLTAERMLAGIGQGLLIGGVAGGAFGAGAKGLAEAGGLAAKGAKDVWGAGKKLGGETAEALGKLYKNATGADLDPKLSKVLAKAQSLATGADEKVLQRALAGGEEGRKFREMATGGDELRNKAVDRMVTIRDRIEAISRDVTAEGKGEAKAGNFRHLMNEGEVKPDLGIAQIESLLQKSSDELEDMLGQGQGVYENVATLRRAVKRNAFHRKKLESVITSKKGEVDRLNDAYIIADQWKREVQQMRKGMKKRDGAFGATRDKIFDMQEYLRLPLEDARVYGKAGVAQEEINRVWTKGLSRLDYPNSFDIVKESREFERIYEANTPAYRTFVNNLRDTGKDTDWNYLKHQNASNQELLDTMAKHLDLSPQQRADVAEAAKLTKEFDDVMNEVKETVVWQNQLRDLTQAGSETAAIAGGGLGYMVGGLPGAIVGAAGSTIMNPGRTIQRLAALERIGAGVKGRIKQSVEGLAGEVKQGAAKRAAAAEKAAKAKAGQAAGFGAAVTSKMQRAAAPAAVNLLETPLAPAPEGEKPKKPKDKQEAYVMRMKELEQLAANPESLITSTTEALSGTHDVAPQVVEAMAAKTGRTAAYLAANMPKPPPRRSTPITGAPPPWTPSDSDIKRFETMLGAAHDPLGILDSLEAGTLSKEAVDVVRELYPGLFGEMTEELITSLQGEVGEKLAYNDRIQLSLVFGVPLDATMEPDFIATMQGNYAPSPPAGQLAPKPSRGQGGGGLRLTAIDSLDTSTSKQPKTERLAQV